MELFKAFWKGFASGMKKEGQMKTQREEPGKQSALAIIKEPPIQIVGECLSAQDFVRYVEELSFPHPLPTRIFLHHTWKPTLEEWRGLDSLYAIKAYYEKQLWEDESGHLHEGWTAGPHLFIADDGIWLFSDLRYDGVGVYGHNYRSRHVEMVGNYDAQRPSGPVLENTIVALGILHERLGLDIEKLNFHRDFSTKSCPGWAVEKEWIIPLVKEWIEEYRREKEKKLSALRRSLVRMIEDLLVPVNPQAALAKAAQARGLLGALTHEIPMEIDDRGYVVQLFAEALIVPVNEWDKVESLHEYEEDQVSTTRSKEDEERHAPPPRDSFDFQGEIR